PLAVRPESPWLDVDVRELVGLGRPPVPTRDRALFFRQLATVNANRKVVGMIEVQAPRGG
ncbi:MAG TPA: hypothetical protein VIL38_09395, partial [Thermaerobacter sp.]